MDIGRLTTVENKIHLLQLIYSFDVEGSGGGIARFVISLCQALNKELFDVSIGGLWNMGTENEQIRMRKLNEEGIKAFTAADWNPSHPLHSLIVSYKGLSRFIKKSSVEVIHSHSEFSDIVTLMLKFQPGVPTIIRTLHNGYPIEWRKRPIRRLVLSNTLYPIFYNSEIGVAAHVVSNLNQRWLARRLGREATLLRNAIDLRRFMGLHHLEEKSKLGMDIPDDGYVIGTVGRLREEKGYAYLLEAASLLVQQYTDPIYFVIIGAGDLADRLVEQARRLQIGERVIFTGPRQDIEFLLSGMDIFVCSSLWEGFSTAVLEAMAAGVPVLATDIPGNRELIKPDVNGWMIPPGDPEALSKEIVNIIAKPLKERQIIARAAEKVAADYSIERIAKQHEEWYQQLQKEKRG